TKKASGRDHERTESLTPFLAASYKAAPLTAQALGGSEGDPMTTATRRRSTLTLWVVGALVGAALARPAAAIPIDEAGDMNLGMAAYTAVRIGTEKIGGSTDPLSYPPSAPGHVRQNRYFLQLDFDHDLTRIARDGWGPARLFGLLDQGFDSLGWKGETDVRYTVQYRGEGEGIYD